MTHNNKIIAWAKETGKKLRISTYDMTGEEGWVPLVYADNDTDAMNKAKNEEHTPGPWFIERRTNDVGTTQQPETQRFTKKPVTITASQWFKSGDHPAVRDISDSDDLFFTGMGGATLVGREKFGVIGTLESPNHLVKPGDWIITGVKGELYPCKPDIFEATYAPETKLQQQGKCLYQIDEPQAKALHLAHTLSGGKLIDDSTGCAAVIAGAIFDFAGYLTTLPREKALHCSEAHEAPPMVEAITEWCKRRGLRTDGARVETWRAALAAQAKQGEHP